MGSDNTTAFDGIDRDETGGALTTPTHLLGDYYVMPEYAPVWWGLAGVLCLLLPPAGAAMLGWMVVGSIEARPDAAM